MILRRQTVTIFQQRRRQINILKLLRGTIHDDTDVGTNGSVDRAKYLHTNHDGTNSPKLAFTVTQRARAQGFTNVCSDLTAQHKPGQ